MVRRIFKMIATSSFLTALKYTKFVFGRGSAPDLTGGAYSASPDLLAGLRGTNSKRGREGGRKLRQRGRGEERKVRHRPPLSQIPGSTPADR